MRNVLVAVVVVLATAMHATVWFVLHERVSPPIQAEPSGANKTLEGARRALKLIQTGNERIHRIVLHPDDASARDAGTVEGYLQ